MADEIKVPIVAVYDDKEAKDAIKDAKAIEKLDPELEITADNSDAERGIEDVADAAGRLSKDDTVVVIKAKIDAAKADIDTLQTELRSLDDEVITPEVDSSKMDHFTESTGKAQGAVHSMAGEAITELPGVGDAVGPAGEAIGQLTEGLLAGEIAMGELVAAAGPLIGLTVAFKVITGFMKTMSESKAFNEAEVKAWTTAINEGKTSIDDIADRFVDIGEVKFNALGGIAQGDLTPLLTKAGVSLDEFATMVKKGPEAFKAWATEAEAAGVSVDLIDGILIGASSIVDDYAEGVKNAANMAKFHGEELDGEAHGLASVNDEFTALKTPVRDATIHIDRFREQTAAADLAYRRLTGTLDEQEAWANVNQAMQEYSENSKHSEEDTRNLIRSIADYVITTDTIPPEKKTEILAELNAGDIAKAEADLAELTRQRDITILLKAVGSQDTIKLLRSITRGGTGILDEASANATATGTSAAAFAAPSTLNVNLPRGARSGDIAKALGISARRTGMRYRSVNYAPR